MSKPGTSSSVSYNPSSSVDQDIKAGHFVILNFHHYNYASRLVPPDDIIRCAASSPDLHEQRAMPAC